MEREYNGRKAWSIAFLLFLAQVVNYFDKSVLSLSSVHIMKELNITPEQYGLISSSFFSLYAVSGVLVGYFFADKIPSKTLLAVLVVIWSGSQLPIVFFASFGVLVASRVVLGIGEGPGSPSATAACHEWFTPERRNMPTALQMLGASVGSLLAGPILSMVIVSYGWRMAFLTCSLLGFAWLALWLIFGETGPGSPVKARAAAATGPALAAPPQGAVWRDPTIIASIVAGLSAYWIVGFTVAWLAPLAQIRLGFDQIQTGWIVSAVAGVNAVLMLSISYASQRLLTAGTTARLARGVVIGACLIGGGIAYGAAAFVTDPSMKLGLIALGGGLPTLTFSLGPALVSGIVPTIYRARFLVMIYAGITVGGFLSPLLAGRLIGSDPQGGYDTALLMNAIVAVAGGVVALALLRPERSLARFDALERDEIMLTHSLR